MLDMRIRGLKDLEDGLNSLRLGVEDTRDFYREQSVQLVAEQCQRVFETVYPRQLVDTGRYKRSLTVPYSADNVVEINRKGMTYGTRVEYAEYLEFGTSRIPPKPVLGYLENDNVFDMLLSRAAERYIERRIEQAGL